MAQALLPHHTRLPDRALWLQRAGGLNVTPPERRVDSAECRKNNIKQTLLWDFIVISQNTIDYYFATLSCLISSPHAP